MVLNIYFWKVNRNKSSTSKHCLFTEDFLIAFGTWNVVFDNTACVKNLNLFKSILPEI